MLREGTIEMLRALPGSACPARRVEAAWTPGILDFRHHAAVHLHLPGLAEQKEKKVLAKRTRIIYTDLLLHEAGHSR